MSFAYKKGIPNDTTGNGGGFVFDCRAVNNPGKYERYKPYNGLDEQVIKFLEDDGEIIDFLDHSYSLVDASVKKIYRKRLHKPNGMLWLHRRSTPFCLLCSTHG